MCKATADPQRWSRMYNFKELIEQAGTDPTLIEL